MNKNNKAPNRYWNYRKLTLGIWIALFSPHILAAPEGGRVSAGTGGISQSGDVTTVQQNSAKLAIDWQSFDVGGKETVKFAQPDAHSIALNRVQDVKPSSIDGTLTANGQVFIVNPNGVVFGKTAQVNVGGLVASTLNLSNKDFQDGNYRFHANGKTGAVINKGHIKAAEGGYVALLGTQVSNEGTIQTPKGTAALAAGERINLDLNGDHLLNLSVEARAAKAQAENKGLIQADGGQVILTAKAQDALLDTVVNNQGIIQAHAISEHNGVIRLEGEGEVRNSGTLDAGATGLGIDGGKITVQSTTGDTRVTGRLDAHSETAHGGNIQVLGERVALEAQAQADASGATGGGQVLIGGDYQGKNPEVHNARITYVDPGASLKADATDQGDGGKVVVWANDTARVHGAISARGGKQGGNGGLVETSGKKYLEAGKAPDISAPKGTGGTWLLDPENLTIALINTNVTPATPFQPAGPGTATLDVATLNTALNGGGTVIVDTTGGGSGTGNLTVSNAIAKTLGPDARLELRAHNDLNINAGITSSTGKLDMVFNPDQDNSGGGVVKLGSITLDANGGTIDAIGKTVNITTRSANINSSFTLGNLNIPSGFWSDGGGWVDPTLGGSGDVTVNGVFIANGGILQGSGKLTTVGTGTVTGFTLNGKPWVNSGSLNIDGAIDLKSGAVFTNNASGIINLPGNAAVIMNNSAGTGTFNNFGTLHKTSASSQQISVSNFNNSGSVNLDAGTLKVAAAGTDSGTYDLAAGAVLDFNGSSHNLGDGTHFTGSGTTRLSNFSALNVPAGSTINADAGHSFEVTMGAFTVDGIANLHNFAISGGAWGPSGGWFDSKLAGSGDVTVNGAFTANGGILQGSGKLTTAGTGTVTGFTLNGKPWVNSGSLNIDGAIDLKSGAVFTNNASGIINLPGNAAVIMNNSAGTGTFNNFGTLHKTSASSQQISVSNFNNSGSVNLDAGTLKVAAAGTDSGTYDLSTGAVLDFNGSSRNLAMGAHFAGAGTTRLSNFSALNVPAGSTINADAGHSFEVTMGTFTVDGIANLHNFAISGGAWGPSGGWFDSKLAGSGDVTVNGAFNPIGGILTGSGTLTTNGTGSITTRVIPGKPWINTGSLDITGANGAIELNNGIVFTNAATGTLMLSGSASDVLSNTAGIGTLNNAGTLHKTSANTQQIRMNGGFINSGDVMLDAGTLFVNDSGTDTSAYTIDEGAVLEFKGATHNLGDGASFAGAGVTRINTSTTVNVPSGATVSAETISTLEVNGGAFNMDGVANLGGFTMSAGSLTGTGNVTVNGMAKFSGGTQSGAATTFLKGPTTISGNFSLDAQRILRNEGALAWTGGIIDLNATANGGSGRIDNAAGGVFDAQGNNIIRAWPHADVNSVAGFPAFNNAGTFRKSAGTGFTEVGTLFNNTGMVDVQTGTLNLSGGGSDTNGKYQGVGTLEFSGGLHTLDAASSITTANITFSGSNTTTVNGTYNVSGTTSVTGGTANLAGSIVGIGNTLNLSKGQLGPGTLNTGANDFSVVSLNQSGSTLIGTGNATVTSSASLSGGAQSGAGSTLLQGSTTISNDFNLDAQRILRNEGTLIWTAGTINLNASNAGGSGRIDNASGAVFDAQGNYGIVVSNLGDQNSVAGFPAFNNAGTFKKSAGAGTTLVDVPFNNTGTADVQTGTLKLSGGGADTGAFTIAGGTLLNFDTNSSFNPHSLGNGTTFAGAGTTKISGGSGSTVVVPAGATVNAANLFELYQGNFNVDGIANLTQLAITNSGGVLGGSGTTNVNGNFTATSGKLAGGGTLKTAGTGTVGGVLNVAGKEWINTGSLDITGSDGEISFTAASHFTNDKDATFTLAGSDFSPIRTNGIITAVFDNFGTLSKTSTGIQSIGLAAQAGSNSQFNNAGNVRIENGTLRIEGDGRDTGGYVVAADTTLDFRTGMRLLDTGSKLDLSGTASISGGAVTIAPGATVITNLGSLVNITSFFGTGNGTLIANSALTMNNLRLGEGTLSGTGSVTVNDVFTANKDNAAHTSSGTLKGGVTLITAGTGTISSAVTLNDNGTSLRNTGNLDIVCSACSPNPSYVKLNGGARLVNETTGTVTFSGTYSGVSSSNYVSVFENAGKLISIDTGTDKLVIDSLFNNTGNVQVKSGTLSINKGGTDTGGYDVPAGSTLVFATFGGVNRTLADSTNMHLAGTLDIQAGTFTMNPGVTLTAEPGSLVKNEAPKLNVNGALSLSNFTNNGYLGGSGSVLVRDIFNNSASGELNGGINLTTAGTGTISGLTTIRDSGTVWRNTGNLNITKFNSAILLRDSGHLINDTGGVVNLSGNCPASVGECGIVGSQGTGTVFDNAGALLKTGSGRMAISVDAFNNSGSVQTQAGNLQIIANGTDTGSYSTAAGSTLILDGGTRILSDQARLDGPGDSILSGNIQISSGTVRFENSSVKISGALTAAAGSLLTLGDNTRFTVNGTTNLADFILNPGNVVDGSSNLTISGNLAIHGGTLVGDPLSTASITSTGHTTVDGPLTVSGKRWAQNGVLDLTGTGNVALNDSASFTNSASGVVNLTGASGDFGNTSGSATFTNSGTLNQATGSHTIKADMFNDRNGTINVTSGTLNVNVNGSFDQSGIIDVATGAVFKYPGPYYLNNRGTLRGSGTIDVRGANLANNGLISPGSPSRDAIGTLTIAGDLLNSSNSPTFDIELRGSAPGEHDLLAVTGQAEFDYNYYILNVIHLGGIPTGSVPVITFASGQGTFGTVNKPPTLDFQTVYNPNDVSLLFGGANWILKVFADPQSKVYGAIDPVFTYNATGLQPGDTVATVLSGSLARIPGESVAGGPYTINQGSLTVINTNYNLDYISNLLTITPASLSAMANSAGKVYGDADPALTYSVSGLQFNDTPDTVLTGSLVRAPGENVIGSPYAVNQGSLAVNNNSNYTLTGFTPAAFTITPAALSVTADPGGKVYGDVDPVLAYTANGFKLGDTAGTVLTGALSRNPGEIVAGSPYAITQGTLAPNSNYTVANFASAPFNIIPAPLSVTANSQSKVYGDADPVLTYLANGFKLGDTATTVFSGSLGRTPGETVLGGPYAINQGSLEANSNYTLTGFTGALLAITPASLTVAANPNGKVYGDPDPALTYTASGLKFNDSNAGVFTGSLVRAPGEIVATGPYDITQGSLALNSSNYTLDGFTPALFAITPAGLSVTANPAGKVYGDADPALTYTASGFKFNDSAANALTGDLSRKSGETVAASPYAITQGTLSANSNYTVGFNSAIFNIAPAALNVMANPQSKVYGDADPTLTYIASGFKLSDTAATVFSGSLGRTPGETVAGGPYPITQGNLVPNSNYTVAGFTGALLAITPALLTVAANFTGKTYGDPDPILPYTASGLKYTDANTNVFTGSLVRAPGETVAGGPYAITQGSLAINNSNYTMDGFTSALFTITPAGLSVAANYAGKVSGEPDPALTYTARGFRFSDTPANVLTGGLSRTPGETAAGSPYTINQGSLAVNNSNYVLAQFTPNLFTIYPAVTVPPIVVLSPIVPPLVSLAGQTQAPAVVAFQTGNMESRAFCLELPEHYYNPTSGYQCYQPTSAVLDEEIIKIVNGGIRLPKERLDKEGN